MTAEHSVLRRKIAGRAAPPPAMTEEKALRLAAAQAGNAALGCAVIASGLRISLCAAEEIGAALPDPGLVMRLEGPAGRIGLAALCPQGMASVIEAATLGRVTAAPAPDRRGTPTDAALAQGLIDRLLAGIAPRLGLLDDPPSLGGYAFAGALGGAQAAVLALVDGPHVVWQADLDIGDANRRARLTLVVPVPQQAALPGAGPGRWDTQWRAQVLGSEARITAELASIEIAATDLARLSPGQLLDLPRAALDRIVLRGAGRMRVGEARLGRIGPLRAVRITLLGAAQRPAVQEPEVIDAGA
ncbi:FliM/FliN family flagellar motor switch protein [Anianabacter salinae]|uniref:FliM/FliN family flagellar motor switch protein n=1 Tax=Anianabacter salinae TaxID=2851023 RepID=UPI00225E046F|nr:FliM/FliN family flagellar motor switch protein [Anianabacter salinae]MBV0912305.1 FliM/FliN family flagellar motor C-terminal domain-containing protein [Anianabacter salinae]